MEIQNPENQGPEQPVDQPTALSPTDVQAAPGAEVVKSGGPGKLRKGAMDIIRTTFRNNADMTAIADNKANILMTLNGIMLTLLIPMTLSNRELIVSTYFYIPLAILYATCLFTVIVSALSTRPIKFGKQKVMRDGSHKFSPFFFGNYYSLSIEEYMPVLDRALDDPEKIKTHIKTDLFFMGKGLGKKYILIRRAYSVFVIGVLLTAVASALVITYNFFT